MTPAERAREEARDLVALGWPFAFIEIREKPEIPAEFVSLDDPIPLTGRTITVHRFFVREVRFRCDCGWRNKVQFLSGDPVPECPRICPRCGYGNPAVPSKKLSQVADALAPLTPIKPGAPENFDQRWSPQKKLMEIPVHVGDVWVDRQNGREVKVLGLFEGKIRIQHLDTGYKTKRRRETFFGTYKKKGCLDPRLDNLLATMGLISMPGDTPEDVGLGG